MLPPPNELNVIESTEERERRRRADQQWRHIATSMSLANDDARRPAIEAALQAAHDSYQTWRELEPELVELRRKRAAMRKVARRAAPALRESVHQIEELEKVIRSDSLYHKRSLRPSLVELMREMVKAADQCDMITEGRRGNPGDCVLHFSVLKLDDILHRFTQQHITTQAKQYASYVAEVLADPGLTDQQIKSAIRYLVEARHR
jgi:hypothetical protein